MRKLEWFSSFDSTFEKYLPEWKEICYHERRKTIRATLDYVHIHIVYFQFSQIPLSLPLSLLHTLALFSSFSVSKMKIAEHKKWHLWGIRIHFPFQWVNFGWLRLHYKCGALVFRPLFFSIHCIEISFLVFQLPPWYESPMEYNFVVHMYTIFCLPFLF